VDKRKQHVLFVCASNVFRSKSAEQAMRDSFGDRVIVWSAGILRAPTDARAENLQEPEAGGQQNKAAKPSLNSRAT
jgi:protein-tyrosine-phosphatase